jgi:hypothetical protein
LTKNALIASIAAILRASHFFISVSDYSRCMNPMMQKTPNRPVNLPPQAPPVGYSPSVPISVYREVIAELQATKNSMEAMKIQNQQLAKQNQQLRQEIERTVQAALQLRQVSTALPGINPAAPPAPRLEMMPDLDDEAVDFQLPVMPARMPVAPKVEPIPPVLEFPEEKLVIEEDSKPRRKIKLEQDTHFEVNGWMLGAVIALIVVTAFGAGFLLVRPFLTPSSK